ncbi:MAG: 23S rRNA (adenine(2503)-C(2))-methyltransferase RlmN [Planctomycetota bacterium]|jgi:23S rRNA (adenine2503-C2)-methyltransferase|nr:23S rRNA (adenine(2503)-C(2))-methyltransferase RlmN [Planctomycetota bacterium]
MASEPESPQLSSPEPARRLWLEADRRDASSFVLARGQPAYRAKQVWDWLHRKRVDSVDAMRNLPASLRRAIDSGGAVRSLNELDRRRSRDGLTTKWLFAAAGPSGRGVELETVLIVEKRGERRTVCVSSMAGCPLGCVFCATGRLGHARDLRAGEIIEQAYRVDNLLALEDRAGVSHVVFMGMGEPLLNLDAVLRAAAMFADPEGLGISGRHVTISTVGIPDGILGLAEAGVNYRLAVSLHAPRQELREKLIPAAKRWPLGRLFGALGVFAARSSRDITFEYSLIDGVNASRRDAEDLAGLLSGFPAKVNLIPLNPVAGYGGKPPSRDRARMFRDLLEAKGVPATIRVEKGAEIGAACGQLRAERLARSGRPEPPPSV